jgi:hypothetical protein
MEAIPIPQWFETAGGRRFGRNNDAQRNPNSKSNHQARARITRVFTHKTIDFRFYCDNCGQVDGTLELGNFITISAINNATTLAAETHARAHSMKTIR